MSIHSRRAADWNPRWWNCSNIIRLICPYATNASTAWLVGKLGDVYVHETAISHVRRLFESELPSTKVQETVAQFKMRMSKVEAYMNSENIGRADHGLETLARRLRERCSEVVRRSGNRIPK